MGQVRGVVHLTHCVSFPLRSYSCCVPCTGSNSTSRIWLAEQGKRGIALELSWYALSAILLFWIDGLIANEKAQMPPTGISQLVGGNK